MKAYRYDSFGLYVGEIECQIDPKASRQAGKEIYLTPANSTLEAPLAPKDGYNVVWDGAKWTYVEIPVEPEPEPHVPTTDEKLAALDSQYEADKAEIMKYYVDSVIHMDVDLTNELADEMLLLDRQYKKDREEIEKE